MFHSWLNPAHVSQHLFWVNMFNYLCGVRCQLWSYSQQPHLELMSWQVIAIGLCLPPLALQTTSVHGGMPINWDLIENMSSRSPDGEEGLPEGFVSFTSSRVNLWFRFMEHVGTVGDNQTGGVNEGFIPRGVMGGISQKSWPHQVLLKWKRKNMKKIILYKEN